MTEIRAVSTIPRTALSEELGITTVTITLTQEEAALVHHVRGNCHLGTICALCRTEARAEFMRSRVVILMRKLRTSIARAHKAEQALDQIISG